MTRPRSSIPPAMAGAVDLSALKQRASQQNEGAAATAGVEITEANFEAEVLARSNEVVVVVVLWSPRSDASAQLADTLGGLAAEDGGTWSLGTVNVDAAPRVAQIFGAQAVPTVVAIAAGQPISSFQGVQPPDQLRSWVDSLLSATAGKLDGGPGSGSGSGEPEQVDPGLAKARELLEAGNFDAALGAYQAILDGDPNHPEAKAAVRQISFLNRATRQRPDAARVADAAPNDIDAAFAAADVDLLHQQIDAAFDRLVKLIQRTSGDDRTRVRTRLLELFELFDPSEPAVSNSRRKLANALY
ncbi:MAG: tetratricopeptide repeat protein [Mycobacteriaceae bacterium]|nr:tetratricopeptide repeat protein [Mycobacteriaceae bacterium]